MAPGGDAALAGAPSANGPREHSETGSVWEIVGTVGATGACTYTFDAPTVCDGSGCMTQFYVSAHTGQAAGHYDSPADSGYSLDNALGGGGEQGPVPAWPDNARVESVRLLPPEPNPGGSRVVIGFVLPEADWVTLQVYDIVGRRVAVLVDGQIEAGSHEAAWDAAMADGQRAAPGVYFASLVTHSEVRTAKLLLVR
jgi:hypothetical protein